MLASASVPTVRNLPRSTKKIIKAKEIENHGDDADLGDSGTRLDSGWLLN